MTVSVLIWFGAGLTALVLGAQLLVRGASEMARALGISSLVVGLTVVAFGTSAPELSISLLSILQGHGDLSVGNVVGSNIANILLILGASAVVTPLVVSAQLVRLDVPIMIAASLLVFVLSWDGRLGKWEGVTLLSSLFLYTVVLVKYQKRAQSRGGTEKAARPRRRFATLLYQIGLVAVGLTMLIYGARWLVESATAVAAWVGLSELVIGLTVVAGGTSLPELATSVVAAVRGERDIAIGNVVGSCSLNLLMVLGAASLVAPKGIDLNPAVLSFDMPVMIAASVACLPIFFTGHLIARWEGALFLGYYAAYVLYLVLRATHHDSLPLFSAIMAAFVLPLTIVTLVVLTFRAWRRQTSLRLE